MNVDKNTIMQVLGSIIKHPQYLSQSDKYNLSINDFNSNFEKVLFNTICGLYNQGLKNIQIIDIENYLQSDTFSQKIFEDNNGIEYLQDIESYADEQNFDFYYNRLKKINLLKDYEKLGIKINDFYENDLTKPHAYEINKKFETLTTKDITENIKKKLYKIEGKYLVNDAIEVQNIDYEIETLLDSYKRKEDIGLPIQGDYINEVMGGARKGTLCIRSGGSGVSKTRQAVGDACYLAFPIRYDSRQCKWVKTGNCEKVLFIATEQSIKEIQNMVMAYLTDINESRFRYGEFSKREEKIFAQTIEIMKIFKDNLLIIRMSNPTIELIKLMIRENVLIHDIKYVFYDYIFISPSLLNEFKGFNVRNDEVLLMMSTALKDLAVELNVFIMTSTQVNASADDNKNIRNEGSLAGGRSTINKADYGLIMARPTREELEVLEPEIKKYGEPNIVTDVYKVRSGRWTQIRIWSNVNLGTLKKEDLFVTDSRLYPIQDFTLEFNYDIMLNDGDNKKADDLLERLNE